MTGIVISSLPPIVTPALTDIYPTTQAGVTYKVTGAQLGTLFLPISGGTLTGSLTLNADPNLALEAATKQYVDSVASGLDVQPACNLGTTANLNAVYVNGASGVGATLTNNGALAALTIDGTLTTVGMRILVKDQATQAQNGIYTVTVVGSGAVAWVLTRATDFDTAAEITPGAYVFVLSGTANAATSYVQTATVVTVGTDAIVWNQFGADINTIITQIQNQSYIYGNDGGAADAYTLTVSPAIASYVAGQRFDVKIANSNTGASTLNVSALGVKNIKLLDGTDPLASNIRAGMVASFEYDGTNFQLLNPNYGTGASTGTGNIVRTTSPTITTPDIIGVANNSSAAAGSVGQHQISTVLGGAGVALTSTVDADITSIAVAAGDYDVWASCNFEGGAGTTTTKMQAWINTASATPVNGAFAFTAFYSTALTLGTNNYGGAVPGVRVSLNAPGTIYLSCNSTFAVSTMNASGSLNVRRRR